MLYFSHFRTTLVTIFSLCSTVCRHQQAEELMQEGKMALRNTSFSAFSSDCVNFQSNWFSSNYNKWYYWLVFVCDKKKNRVKTKNQAVKYSHIKTRKNTNVLKMIRQLEFKSVRAIVDGLLKHCWIVLKTLQSRIFYKVCHASAKRCRCITTINPLDITRKTCPDKRRSLEYDNSVLHR